ncbi:MAG: hypothetical protein OXG34_07675 [bacterium]|nr:hypothetical protein [bacterium]MCY3889066.1 hypothetical protein [bacterium]MCY3961531.1 hypothetical protein [bacterium]
MNFVPVTCGNTGDDVQVGAVIMARLDDVAWDVWIRWLACGRWGRESLKR